MNNILKGALCGLLGAVIGLVLTVSAWMIAGLFTDAIVIKYIAGICTYPLTFFLSLKGTRKIMTI